MALLSETGTHSILLQVLVDYWAFALAGLLVLGALKTYFHHGLNRYPGPFLANFTNAWRLWDVRKGQHHLTLIALHERYGPVVRTGPNTLDISDVQYVPEIYGIKKGFTKSAFYHTFTIVANGKVISSMFSTRDEHEHSERKRAVAGMYSLSGLQEYEPLVDEMIKLFMDKMKTNFDGPGTKGTPCDMSAWLQFYAFDVILNITMGSTMGFMAQGADAGDFIAELGHNLRSNAVHTQMPWLVWLHRRNPIRVRLNKQNTIFPSFVRQHIFEHQAKIRAESESVQAGEKPSTDSHGDDMLTRFMRLPGVPREWVSVYALQNVFAGSDTTAITLRAVLYFLLKNPHSMQKLLAELRTADPPLSYPVTWKESQRLPYLHAVVEEALRICPAFGLSLEREVPAAGLHMPGGYNLPAGTAVGMNAWVVHQDASVFGPLPTDEFHPERWMQAETETESDFEARSAVMRRVLMSFGWGKRICLGRNISYLEIYKLIPTLLLEFEIGLVNPSKEWSLHNAVFVHQTGIDCWVRSRGLHV